MTPEDYVRAGLQENKVSVFEQIVAERDRYKVWLEAIKAQTSLPVNRPQNMATMALRGDPAPVRNSADSGGTKE